ncbi:MAG: hypothetical protein GF341_03100 [candidate division Zixibacteria bacterium]|nr:hypothetical protein [candidate division Zixibacteria bacterium]
MSYGITIPRILTRAFGLCLLAMVTAVLAISCGGGDETASTPEETATTPPDETSPTTASQESGGDANREFKRPAEWILSMRKWPDTLRWEIDSSFTYTVEDLELRFRVQVVQDLSGTRFQGERPVFPEILMIVSPVPKWDYARHLGIDSLVFYDPIKSRRLPALPILSFQRSYENQTVRTLYNANSATKYRISPDLDDGQPLDPTLYLTWEERTIIAEFPPITLRHTLEPVPQEEEEIPPDYRVDPPNPDEGP